VLTKVHGHSVSQAAMIAGTTPGAIKLRAHRAYVTLRARMANRGTEARKAR
jgi:DNA-directed RNA polymerase specialized sigma24 family protein